MSYPPRLRRRDGRIGWSFVEVKVHRRIVRLDGADYTVLSLRPSDSYRFATNYFHETWHVLSDIAGGRLFGHLCWAMAFQRQARTLLVIEPPNLIANPFDADPSNSIVIANSDIGAPSRQALDELRRKLPFRTKSEGTSQLNSFGLDRYAERPRTFFDEQDATGAQWRKNTVRIDRINGLIVLAAPADNLKVWGVELAGIGTSLYGGQDYASLNHRDNTGEVQIFEDFRGMARRAALAREALFPGRAHEELSLADRQKIYDHLEKQRASSAEAGA